MSSSAMANSGTPRSTDPPLRSTSTPIHAQLQWAPTLGGSDAILWGAAAATGALWAKPR